MQDPTMTTTSVATDTVMHDNERIITEVTVRKSAKKYFPQTIFRSNTLLPIFLTNMKSNTNSMTNQK